MKTVARIVSEGVRLPGGFRRILDEAGCGPDVEENDELVAKHVPTRPVMVRIDVSDPRLRLLLSTLAKYGLEWQEWRRDFYTDEELEAARLMHIHPLADQTIVGGTYPGTRYVLGAGCPVCGAGVEQDSPLMIDHEDIPKLEGRHVVAAHRSELIVDDGIMNELLSLNLKGVSFGSVYGALEDKRQIKLPWHQVRPARSLPKMSWLSTGAPLKKPCKRCDRSGYMPVMNDPPRLVYRARDVEDIDDVMTSWEWFGDVRLKAGLSKAVLPYPWLFVTPRVMRVLRATGTEAFDWLPIRVVESDAD